MKDLRSLIILSIILPPVLLREEMGARSKYITYRSRRRGVAEAKFRYWLHLNNEEANVKC
jgi:hypothetical protein